MGAIAEEASALGDDLIHDPHPQKVVQQVAVASMSSTAVTQ
jgi:hypothetical protein